MKTLPDKPSELIRLALHDLEEVEQLPGFRVNMNVWLSNIEEEGCAVCLAGAVMVRSLYQANDRNQLPTAAVPGMFDADTHAKLSALDYFRSGETEIALEYFEVPDPHRYESLNPGMYYENPAAFKKVLREMADYFEGEGL